VRWYFRVSTSLPMLFAAFLSLPRFRGALYSFSSEKIMFRPTCTQVQGKSNPYPQNGHRELGCFDGLSRLGALARG
jgi:hypothetical protein